jgi:3'-5' exoribonuclease
MNATEKLIYWANNLGVTDIANFVLKDPRFSICSASSSPNSHHYGNGQLAIHTLEVIELCFAQNEYFLKIGKGFGNLQILFLSGLFHDAGKMWDYEKIEDHEVETWKSTPHKYLIHHIARSALLWSEAVKATNRFKEEEDQVLHAILSHHGRLEWGSPVLPSTPLAYLLHFSDNLSASMDKKSKF